MALNQQVTFGAVEKVLFNRRFRPDSYRDLAALAVNGFRLFQQPLIHLQPLRGLKNKNGTLDSLIKFTSVLICKIKNCH
jgi:hypothetical protein